MSTISQWLDSYDGEDNIVAGVARIWRSAKDESDARPRVSAPQSVSTWLAEHRGVADESLRAAVRAYHESRGGRQATEAEVGAFRAMNSPGTIAPVPGDHEQPAGPSPAMMAALGRIEQAIVSLTGSLEKLTAGFLGPLEGKLDALLDWTALQDERIKPITDLLGELAEAEQAPDQGEPDPAQLAADMRADQAINDHELAEAERRAENEAAYPQVTGSLWAQIAAPEPDPERMAQLGDPRLVEDEG